MEINSGAFDPKKMMKYPHEHMKKIEQINPAMADLMQSKLDLSDSVQRLAGGVSAGSVAGVQGPPGGAALRTGWRSSCVCCAILDQGSHFLSKHNLSGLLGAASPAISVWRAVRVIVWLMSSTAGGRFGSEQRVHMAVSVSGAAVDAAHRRLGALCLCVCVCVLECAFVFEWSVWVQRTIVGTWASKLPGFRSLFPEVGGVRACVRVVDADLCDCVSPQLLAEQYLHSIAMAHHGLKYAVFPHFMVECAMRDGRCVSCRMAGVWCDKQCWRLLGGVGLGGSNANQSMVRCVGC